MPDACQLVHADLDVGDIERLRSQKDKHMKDIEGMGESLKTLHKKQRQLEDEEAKIRKQKVSYVFLFTSLDLINAYQSIFFSDTAYLSSYF